VKHELLKEVWRIRDEIGAECGYDVKRLAALIRREEAKVGRRLVRAPKPTAAHKRMAVHHGS
jgi:hypothetical protein